jgi:hypothetical protein
MKLINFSAEVLRSDKIRDVDNSLRHAACPLCGSSIINFLGIIERPACQFYSSVSISLMRDPEIWECTTCQSRFTQNAVTSADSRELYSIGSSNLRWSYKGPESSYMDTKPRRFRDLILQLLAQRQSVLDVGSNDGAFLDVAKTCDLDTCGVEFSETGRLMTMEKGHRIYADMNEVEQKFDLITAFDLVEHCYDLPGFLRLCSTKMSSNGRLVVFTGNPQSLSARVSRNGWWYSRYPEHVVFPSLKYMSELNYFSIEKILLMPHRQLGVLRPVRICVSLIKDAISGGFSGFSGYAADHYVIVLRMA